jgi:multiple sugar transport system substrate-binding protein
MIPALNSAREEPAFTDSVQYGIREQVEALHFLPAIPGLGDVQLPTLEVAVNEAILGQTAPDEALSKQASNATEMMQDNLEKFGG